MSKFFNRKTCMSVLALVMGASILLAPLTTYAANFQDRRQVAGDGVRLRKAPSFEGTILELMYRNDWILIDREFSDNYWVHVKRESTQTTGYMGYDLYDHS